VAPYPSKNQSQLKPDQPVREELDVSSLSSPEFSKQPSTTKTSTNAHITLLNTANMHVQPQAASNDVPLSTYRGHLPSDDKPSSTGFIQPHNDKEINGLSDTIMEYPSAHPTNAAPGPAGQTSLRNVLPPININRLASPDLEAADGGWNRAIDSYLALVAPKASEKPDDPSERPKNQEFKTNSEYDKALKYISSKPTCSLNLVCYRSGSAGCELEQVQVVAKTRSLTSLFSKRQFKMIQNY
jgi:hypothetical protein